ncbi:unnamed protein product [Acanthoscelides obtectus]|uniref:UPAR/Ly6 domain-containing protein qvr n=1 Tax=Acanthoscelides obtectus TaxID=200917 RepID=A0A9P0PA47_ACAOB|nr:unnamed protein product [Acanthoscelides obtectus]CAK1631839.1 hypothetical protein AOBTE_LOCUS7192 [Acanthoscelides obtectus]
MKISLIFLVLAVQSINHAYSLVCYQCQETIGKNLACEKNVITVLTENCTQNFVCIKYIHTEFNLTSVTRGCSPRTRCEELNAQFGGSLEKCSTCNEDRCNSSFINKSSVVFSLITSASLLFRIFL